MAVGSHRLILSTNCGSGTVEQLANEGMGNKTTVVLVANKWTGAVRFSPTCYSCFLCPRPHFRHGCCRFRHGQLVTCLAIVRNTQVLTLSYL
jgi:hypothetical protein